MTPEDADNIIKTWLPTLQNRGLKTIEIAFFGGSFTGLPLDEQAAFLRIAQQYKQNGLVDKIHLSTRPDYISPEILELLRAHNVDIIELGVQSFDDAVLTASNRGHTADDVYRACDLIHTYGFTLGIQLMIGLPGDTMETALASARAAVSVQPAIARLYPTVVLHDTALSRMYQNGTYHALTTEEAVSITKEMYRILDAAGINIIRVGLKSTDLIREDGEIQGHTYHPAFRQLVEGELAKETLEQQLQALLSQPEIAAEAANGKTLHFTFMSSGTSFSNMIGNARRNKLYFAKKYPQLKIRYQVDPALDAGCYCVVK